MGAYEGFAALYDGFMDVDYEGWLNYIETLWTRFGKTPELVLDLGCGTGGMTLALAKRGYSPIGVDLSQDMLAIAREKAEGVEDVLFLCQDMRAFELYGTVDSVLCLCDSLNYMTEPEDLLQVFRLVNNYLDPGGLFIFDMNTPYKFQHLLGDSTFAEVGEDAAYIWENQYDPETKRNDYDMTFFAEREDGAYERFSEVHEERAYSKAEIEALLIESGLKVLAVYDAYTLDPPREDSERWFFVAQEIAK